MDTAIQHLGMASFGDFFRALREKKMLTQDELAARAGVSRSSIQNLEKMTGSERRPYTLRAIAESLGLGLDEIEEMWKSADLPPILNGSPKIEPSDDTVRREVEGYIRLLGGDALGRVWDLAREECKAKLVKATPRREYSALGKESGTPPATRQDQTGGRSRARK